MEKIVGPTTELKKPSLIFLTGFMASGKSTVGLALAETLRKSFFDLDVVIENRLGKTIAEIFQDEGALFFREIEREILLELSTLTDAVIALGGGTLLELENLFVVQQTGILICLTTTPEETWNRIADTDKRNLILRPGRGQREILAMNKIYERIETLVAIRKPGYDHSNIIIDTTRKTVPQIVQEIMISIEPYQIFGQHHDGKFKS